MIPTAHLKNVLSEQYAELTAEPTAARPLQRLINIADLQGEPEATVITGVRRCGKSTLVQQHARKLLRRGSAVLYLTFEDSRLDGFTLPDFNRLFDCWSEMTGVNSADTQITIIIDEIQAVAGWEKWVAQQIRNPRRKIYVTGSTSSLMETELATLLTGRHITLRLTPLSLREIWAHETNVSTHTEAGLGAASVSALTLTRFLERGGFPRSYLGNSRAILANYFKDIIERDLIARRAIRNTYALRELARILCAQDTRMLNRSRMARTLEIKTPATIATFCKHLEDVYLFSEVRQFHLSRRRQLRNPPRYFCCDPILARTVAQGIGSSSGAVLEGFVFQELLRRGQEIYYWSSAEGFEIDFLLARGTTPTKAIQVTHSLNSAETLHRETRALLAAKKELKIDNLTLVTLESSPLDQKLPEEITLKSFSEFMLELY